MSCNTKTSLAAVIDAVNAQLNNNYVDRDDPRINQGVFTEPTIRGGLMLDEAAKLDFCGYVTECGQQEPFGKQWVDRPLYPYNTLVSYDDGGEIKSRWQDIDDVVAGTGIGVSYSSALSMIADTGLKVGRFVETLGYTQPGDGGENGYIIEAVGTQVVDGGAFIELSNGLIAKALFQGAIRPQHFGATADKDCTLEMHNLNKYINTLDGCVVEFITDIKAQPVSWKPVSSIDPKIYENISAHVLHVPANSTIKMLNGAKLSYTVLPRRFRNAVILCDHESHNSELINPHLEGAYDDATVTNSSRIIILEDNLSGIITTESNSITIPSSILKAGTTPVVVSTTSLDFFDYTGSEINPSGKDVSSLEKSAASVSLSGGTATIKLDVAVKNIVVTFRDVNDVTRTIRGEYFYRGEWGMGLSLRSAKNLRVLNLVSNNHAGDGLSIMSASHYLGYNNSDIVFNNTNIKGCRRQGISICALEHTKFNDTYISDIKGTLPSAGIDIETDQGLQMEVKDVEFNKLDIRRVAGDGFIIYNLSASPLHYLTMFVDKIYQDIRLKDVYIEDTGRSGFAVVRMPYPNKLRVDGLHIKNAGRHGIALEYPATKEGVPKNLQFHDVLVDTVGANPVWSSAEDEHVAFYTYNGIGKYSNAEAEGYVVGGMHLSDLHTIGCNMYPKSGQFGVPYRPYNTIAPRSTSGVMRPIGVGSYLTPVDYTKVVTENAGSIYYLSGGGNTVLHSSNITSVELLSGGSDNVVTRLVNMTGNVLNIKGSFAKSFFSDSFRLADGSSVTLMADTKSSEENPWIILSVFPAISV